MLSCHREATMIIIVAAKFGGRAWSRNEIVRYKDAFNLTDQLEKAQNATLTPSGWLLDPRPKTLPGFKRGTVRKCVKLSLERLN